MCITNIIYPLSLIPLNWTVMILSISSYFLAIHSATKTTLILLMRNNTHHGMTNKTSYIQSLWRKQKPSKIHHLLKEYIHFSFI